MFNLFDVLMTFVCILMENSLNTHMFLSLKFTVHVLYMFILALGIDPKTTQDGLENYLQNRANVRVSNISRDASKAVVTFASDIGIS